MRNTIQHCTGWSNYVLLFFPLNKIGIIPFLQFEYSIDVHGIFNLIKRIFLCAKILCTCCKSIPKQIYCVHNCQAHMVIIHTPMVATLIKCRETNKCNQAPQSYLKPYLNSPRLV